MKKQDRIKKNEEFSRILSEKQSKSDRFFVVYHSRRAEDHARIGISVSKKLGDAVVRNKIKRQIRMMCMQLFDLKEMPMDLIIIVRKAYLEKDYQTNKNDLEKLVKKNIMVQYEQGETYE